jgi:uncharacterized repeat protein (TIGR04076 family)
MTTRKLSEDRKEFCRRFFGYGDEEFKIIEGNPKQFELFERGKALNGKKMIATCVESENCGMNKVGDRYVFTASGMMIKDETCKLPCLWAMSNFFPFSYILYDRAASGLDLKDMHFEYVSCPDNGCKYGGWGKAMFRISVENA